ncbi:hypothetical protein [Enemella sp. A6]|uniref:aggregation-promoting factor C-terminal-like domain-containing protein n=1 Tax=Enemella sp. A6 TaxID=3440152 RepID=UPI003EBB887A
MSPRTDTTKPAPIVKSAGTKVVGQRTSTWGRFVTNRPITAWTEVLVNGQWRTSQMVTTTSAGNFTIPLTYGATTPGKHTFRVRGRYPDGTIVTGKSFTLTRIGKPTAKSAGRKLVNTPTSTWGRFDTRRPITAWTEVRVNGKWRTSQKVTTAKSGNYVIPLTYGATVPGNHVFRVRGRHADGTITTSAPFTLTRTTGTKQDWMRAAGIPTSDWAYVDSIVQRESGWNRYAVNPWSGACGLAQANPCSKVGSQWADPVVSLRWQHSYVKGRYGSYRAAHAFWQRNKWY